MYHRHITSFKVPAYLFLLKMRFHIPTKDLVATYTCTVNIEIKTCENIINQHTNLINYKQRDLFT